MKVQSSLAAQSATRNSFYSSTRKRPSPSSSSTCSSASSSASSRLHKRRSSPLDASSSPPTSHSDLASQQALQDALPKVTGMHVTEDRDWKNLFEREYREDIEAYLHEMETRTLASVELIDIQPELAWYMRPYLIDFLIEIHQQYRLRPETLYLAINIVDRYVSKRIVFKKHYQLVGCAALWIAAKFEDAKDRVPSVHDLCQMCCGAYDESAFIQMESHVLNTINWVLGHPTAEAWLRLASAPGYGHGFEDQRVQHTARFLMEITLFYRGFVPHKSSDVAAGALVLARYMLGKPRRHPVRDESPEVIQIAQLLDTQLAEHLDQVSQILIKKYSFQHYSRASTFVREWFLSGRRFNYASWPTPMRLSPSTSLSSNLPRSLPVSPSSSSTGSECSSTDDSSYDEPLTPMTPLAVPCLWVSDESKKRVVMEH